MKQSIAKLLLAGGMTLASLSATAAPVILANGVAALTLGAPGGCYQMAVSYDPGNHKYYGGGGGYSGCNGTVWNAAGSMIQSISPINVDVRGVNYNANTQQIEIMSYGAQYGYGGLLQMGRDGAGMYTTSNTTLLSSVTGAASDQSVAAYDAGRDVYYSTAYHSGTVNVARHSDGGLAEVIALSGHSTGSTVQNSIGYDLLNDVLVSFDYSTNDALVFDMSGSFLGASHLAGAGFDTDYAMSYTNGMLFVGNGYTDGYTGFQIMEAAPASAVPEPASYFLIALGLLAAVGARRLRRN